MGYSYEQAKKLGIGHLHPNAPGNKPERNAKRRQADSLAVQFTAHKDAPTTPEGPGPWEIVIERWTPPSVNELLHVHWAKANRIKKGAAELIAYACREAGVPRATGKRRVSMVIYYPRMDHAIDPDNAWKAVNDALKHAGAIVDDRAEFLELGPCVPLKGRKRTVIRLERVDP